MYLHKYTLADLNSFFSLIGPCFRGRDVCGLYEVLEEYIDTTEASKITIDSLKAIYLEKYINSDEGIATSFLTKFNTFLEGKNNKKENLP